jgi:hypothetical protein
MLPIAIRGKANAVVVNKFSPEDIQAMHTG